MTRKLAGTILITVWGLLLIGGFAAYFTARSALISELDHLLFARAAALPELLQGKSYDPLRVPGYDWRDTYDIRDESGQSVPQSERGEGSPQLLNAYSSTSPDGRKQRSVVVRSVIATTKQPVTVTYTGSAEHIGRLLRNLAFWLAIFGISAGLLTAAVGIFFSRKMLRPLRETARLMNSINEQKLHRRMQPQPLSPEIAPIAEGLNEMLNRLELAFAQKRQLIADASHQISAPVAALLTAMQNAMHSAGDKNYREVLDQCVPQLQILRRLVERLVEQAQSELAGESIEAIDVTEMLTQCCNVAADMGSGRSIVFIRSIPRDLKCHISAHRLRSVVNDLLANAVQYSDAGGKVELSCLHDGTQLRIRIGDSGSGIATEQLPRLFQPFDRVDRAADPEHLGLGLFLVQSHVRAMEGKIRIDTGAGKGTAVDVEIPCERVKASSDLAAAYS